MNNLKYNGILYFIAAVFIATLSVQIYWNYKNYQVGKQQLLNDVQTSLDNAVDQYYTQLATNSTFNFPRRKRGLPPRFLRDSLYVVKDTARWSEYTFNLRNPKDRGAFFQTKKGDSVDVTVAYFDTIRQNLGKSAVLGIIDSLSNPIEQLSTKIIVSFTEDEFSLDKIDSLLQNELNRKSIAVDYGLSHTGFLQQVTTLRPELIETAQMETSTSSHFIYDNSLTIYFSNITLSILKKNLLGILLSFLLAGSVLFCLLYLLRIIRHQKQLAEVKNDLISNITHEFKTPIATIGVAMEAISNFNASNDHEKNLRYASISAQQVEKLNGMVEKLLETATLDSQQLQLKKERANLVELVRNTTQKESLILAEKTLHFHSDKEEIWSSVDVFHFENAVNNMVDNAIKYGGDRIDVFISENSKGIQVEVKDSGNSLTDVHKRQIFEKFYRVPKGNTHDVKGFGIGLYYTKTIIEKHGGTVGLTTNGSTCFKIQLPHA